MNSLDGKVALMTASGQGIGLATAKAFSNAGAYVIATDINEKTLHNASSVPVDEIDLLIRTGGDRRISNFLLYQIAYAEIMFIDKYWPDFSSDEYKLLLFEFLFALTDAPVFFNINLTLFAIFP